MRRIRINPERLTPRESGVFPPEEAAGFLLGASHVEIFELEATSLEDRLAEALSRVGDADSEVTGRPPGG